jgi:hypothetical protein
MRRSVSLLAISLSFCACAQREGWVEHNRLVDSAEFLAFKGRHQDALTIYERLMRPEAILPGPYFDAIETCLLTGQSGKANEFLSIAVQHGFVPEVFRFDSLLMAHMGSDASKEFRDKRRELEMVFAAKADSALIQELGAMFHRDQRVRKDGSDDATMHLVDSLNFERLIALCEQRGGFPNSGALGNGAGHLHSLLWHHRSPEYPVSDQWERILPYIHEAIDAGELSPAYLCMFDDFADQEAGRPMRYGALLYYYQSMPELLYFVDRATLDRNRASVGWGPITWFAETAGIDLGTVRFAAP